MSAKGVIFSAGETTAENLLDAWALDGLILSAYFAENGPDPSCTAFMDPKVHPNPEDVRVFWEACDPWSEALCVSLGFTIVEVDRPGEWFPGPVMPS